MKNITIIDIPFIEEDTKENPYIMIQLSLELEDCDKRITNANLNISEDDMCNNVYNKYVIADAKYYFLDDKIDKHIELYYVNGYTSRQYFASATEEEYTIINRYITSNKQDILKLLKINNLIDKNKNDIRDVLNS